MVPCLEEDLLDDEELIQVGVPTRDPEVGPANVLPEKAIFKSK